MHVLNQPLLWVRILPAKCEQGISDYYIGEANPLSKVWTQEICMSVITIKLGECYNGQTYKNWIILISVQKVYACFL